MVLDPGELSAQQLLALMEREGNVFRLRSSSLNLLSFTRSVTKSVTGVIIFLFWPETHAYSFVQQSLCNNKYLTPFLANILL